MILVNSQSQNNTKKILLNCEKLSYNYLQLGIDKANYHHSLVQLQAKQLNQTAHNIISKS